MTYKIISLILTLLMTAALLTSCGGASSDTDTPATGDASSTSGSASGENTLSIQSQKVVDSPEWFTKLDASKDCEQLIVVAGVGETTCYVSMHEKDTDGKWKMILQAPGYIGLEGMGKADSYHAVTPIGTFTIDKAFGIADDPGCQMEYTKVDDNYYWSGDYREGMPFNQLVSIKDYPDLDKEESERIADYDYAYQYVLNMGYNAENIPEKGCAFFLHSFRFNRPYTGGCVAVPEDIMKFIMQHVKPGCKITIDSLENFGGDLDA